MNKIRISAGIRVRHLIWDFFYANAKIGRRSVLPHFLLIWFLEKIAFFFKIAKILFYTVRGRPQKQTSFFRDEN